MAYGALLIGPVGVALVAAVAIYKLLLARREEALPDAGAASTQQPLPRPALLPPRDRGYFPGTPPRILYGDVGVVVHRSLEEAAVSRPLEAADTLPGSEQVGVADGEEPGQVLETVGEIDEEIPPQSSMVAVGWHRACSYVRESTSMAFEWRPNPRVLRGAVEIADAYGRYYFREGHFFLRACWATFKREMDRQQQQQAPAFASKFGKELKELHTKMDHVRTQIDELRLQNKELLDQIGRLSASKIAKWTRAAWDFAGAGARYLLRGCQLILQRLYGTLKRIVNEWRQKQEEVEQLRQEIREMRQQNRQLLEQLMTGGESRALPTQLNPP